MSEKDVQLLQKIHQMLESMEERLAVLEGIITKGTSNVSDNVKAVLASYKNDFLSVSQLAGIIDYSVAGVRDMIKAEKVEAVKMANGKNWKIPKSEVERILQEAEFKKQNNTGEFKKVQTKHRSAA